MIYRGKNAGLAEESCSVVFEAKLVQKFDGNLPSDPQFFSQPNLPARSKAKKTNQAIAIDLIGGGNRGHQRFVVRHTFGFVGIPMEKGNGRFAKLVNALRAYAARSNMVPFGVGRHLR